MIMTCWFPKHGSNNPEHGFTLVEVLVSFLILSFVIVTALSIFARSNQYLTLIREYSTAMAIAKRNFENIRNMKYSDVTSIGPSLNDTDLGRLPNASGEWNVQDVYSDPDLRKVSLQISWLSQTGRTISLDQVTYVTRKGISLK